MNTSLAISSKHFCRPLTNNVFVKLHLCVIDTKLSKWTYCPYPIFFWSILLGSAPPSRLIRLTSKFLLNYYLPSRKWIWYLDINSHTLCMHSVFIPRNPTLQWHRPHTHTHYGLFIPMIFIKTCFSTVVHNFLSSESSWILVTAVLTNLGFHSHTQTISQLT